MKLFEQGYREARWGLRPTFLEPMPGEYATGYQLGRRKRRMQKAIEFAVIAIVVATLSVALTVVVADALAARMPV